jgi:hypothetical protein
MRPRKCERPPVFRIPCQETPRTACRVVACRITISSSTIIRPLAICAITELIGSTLKSSAQRIGLRGSTLSSLRSRCCSNALYTRLPSRLRYAPALPAHKTSRRSCPAAACRNPDPSQQMPVLARVAPNCLIPLLVWRRICDTPSRNPSASTPRSRTTPRFRVPQPAFQPQPRLFLRVSQFVQSEPRQVRAAQPFEIIHRPEQDPRSRILHHQRILGLVVIVRNVACAQYLEQRRLRRVPQHRVSRRTQQSRPSRIQVSQPDRFLAQRLALAASDRPRVSLVSGRTVVKGLL